MSSNVGLSTPRGSGTSGYVQRNLSLLKPRSTGAGAPYQPNSDGAAYRPPPATRKPDAAILNHDRLREIEIQVLALRDRLEEEDEDEKDEEKRLGEEQIEERCEKLREKLVREMERDTVNGRKADGKGRPMKRYAVHELAEAKIKESDRLRRALGLRGNEVGGDERGNGADGGDPAANEHPMARQERRKRERDEERMRQELAREQDGGYREEAEGAGGSQYERRERYDR